VLEPTVAVEFLLLLENAGERRSAVTRDAHTRERKLENTGSAPHNCRDFSDSISLIYT
jgi:hypothetical protein